MALHTEGRCTLAFITDALGHLRGRVGINVDMTYAFIVLNHRHLRTGRPLRESDSSPPRGMTRSM